MAHHHCGIFLKEAVLPGHNDVKMGPAIPANSLHALVYTVSIISGLIQGFPNCGSQALKGSRNDLHGLQRLYQFLQRSVKLVYSQRPLTFVKNSSNSTKHHS